MSDVAPNAAPITDPRSIYNVLATLPSGKPGATLSDDELSHYLSTHYNTEQEKDRNKRHVLRDELYRDGGVAFMHSFIEHVFDDPVVREKRKKFVKYARTTNAVKRIVNRLSTIYAEPALRFVAGEADQVKYKALLDAVNFDETMLQVSRMLNLHRALLVGFRVRMLPDGTREPVIDIATPANVRAVVHPNDSKLVVGWMIRTDYRCARDQANAPKWTLWTAVESVQLRDDLSIIGGTYQTHGLGLVPWVPITLGPPVPGFFPGEEGEDLVSAHVAIWLQNVLLLKESKSATKQTTIQGDGTNMMRGQSLDSEVPTELQDGQSLATTDMSMDLGMFRDTGDHLLDHVAQNYELTPSIVRGDSVQSAAARELMLLPLKEIRRQQQIPFRRFEAALVLVIARVLSVDLPVMEFDPAGWRMEFVDSQTPLDPLSEQTLFEKRRAAGIDNTIAMIMRLRPGISPEDAMRELETNIEIETERNVMMRPLQAIAGSLGAELPSNEVKVTETEAIAPPADSKSGSGTSGAPSHQ